MDRRAGQDALQDVGGVDRSGLVKREADILSLLNFRLGSGLSVDMTWKRCQEIGLVLLALIGLAGLTDDLTKWREWLSFLWNRGLINWACLIIGAGGLAYPHRAKIIEWFRKDSDLGSIQSMVQLSLMLPLVFVAFFLMALPLIVVAALLRTALKWLAGG